MELRNVFLGAAFVSLALALPLARPAAAANPEITITDPAHVAMLGSGVTAEQAARLGSMLRAAPAGDGQVGSGPPFYTALRSTGTAESPRYEGSGIFDLRVSGAEPLRFESARVVLTPSADGRTCRFELSGAPFGPASRVEATGSVEWKTGPAGGDKLELEVRVADADVDLVRAWMPNRVDASFSGVANARLKGSGVVGEVTTEELPATPLKGDLEATLDWTALGRTSPMTIRSQFSLDDRNVRFINGRMSWLEEALDFKGWSKTEAAGDYELIASFANVDTAAVATRWNVAPEWRPAATLTGTITMKGTPGKGLIRYESKAPLVTMPGIAGYDVRIENARLSGSLLAINAEVACSVRADRTVIGGIDLGPLPIGVKWWRNELSVNNSNSQLFGGENDGSFSYEPANHPEFSFHGRVKNGVAADIVKAVAPWSGLDVEGSGSVAFIVDQDKDRNIEFAFHGSLTHGRIGGADLFGGTLDALSKADPDIRIPAGAAPVPRKGTGTRVDRWFFEADRKGDTIELGGLFINAGDFLLSGDGNFTRAGGLTLDGSVVVPGPIATPIVASAPYLAKLRRAEGDPIFVGIKVTGPLSALQVSLSPAFAELVAKAKRGEAVEPPGIYEVRHVGPDNVAVIPVDPANENLQ